MVKWLEDLNSFARRDSIYVLMFSFIVLFNLILASASTPQEKAKTKEVYGSKALLEKRDSINKTDELEMSRKDIENILEKRPGIFRVLNLTSLAFILFVILSILINVFVISVKLEKGVFDIATYRPPPAAWSLGDVARVVILFFFFSYIIVISESFLANLVPLFKWGNFRTMLNSSIMDILTAVFIVYFIKYKYGQRIISLGLTIKNIFRNISYGLIAYIACVPIFLAVTFFVFLVVKVTGYVPQKQYVVEMFLKEENPTLLIYSSVFASILGPIVEEIFFRGFMYNAVKKLTGVFWAVVLVSAVFAALHTNVVGFLPIMVLGLVLTYMYEKTGSLIPSITIHIAHNAAMVFLVFLVKEIKAI